MEEQTPHNPYLAPTATLTEVEPLVPAGTPDYAGRGRRLGANMLDGLILTPISVPFVYLVLYPHFLGVGGLAAHQALQQADTLTKFKICAVNCVFGICLYLLVNGHLLNKSGQTVGKRLLKIRMVRPSGERAGLPALALRIIFYSLIWSIPGVAPGVGLIAGLVDILMIFSSNRRCLHDYVAGTIVVKAEQNA